MMVRCGQTVERPPKITMRALRLARAAQRLFQDQDRVQRNSFQHAIVKFRLLEKQSANGATLTASLAVAYFPGRQGLNW